MRCARLWLFCCNALDELANGQNGSALRRELRGEGALGILRPEIHLLRWQHLLKRAIENFIGLQIK